jgi:hypothetical protein
MSLLPRAHQLLEGDNILTPSFKKNDKVFIFFIFFYSLSIYTLIKAFIIQQTLLFLNFKTYYLIYYNMLLKITNFITVKFLNPPKKKKLFCSYEFWIREY